MKSNNIIVIWPIVIGVVVVVYVAMRKKHKVRTIWDNASNAYRRE